MILIIHTYAQVFTLKAMQIYIEKLNGDSITLDIEASDTIEAVKGKIQKKEGIAPDTQKLFNGEGQELFNGKPISEYNIQNGDTLQVVVNNNKLDITYVEALEKENAALKKKSSNSSTI